MKITVSLPILSDDGFQIKVGLTNEPLKGFFNTENECVCRESTSETKTVSEHVCATVIVVSPVTLSIGL
jgi:hypothetical protein